MRLFLFPIMLANLVGLASLPASTAGQAKKAAHPRGRVAPTPAVLKARHEAAFARHGHRMRGIPKTAAVSFDCQVTFGNELPENDQGQCGDCFGVSSADACSMALIKAGVLPYDGTTGRLSSQFGLDSGAFVGGCNGGDEAQVIDYLKTNGFPLTSDYGPYVGGPQRLKPIAGMTMYKIADWGYCTPSQEDGIANTQDIKNAMVRYGPISVAFDAGECDDYQWPQTMRGRGRNVDHAVLCVGWDDNHDNGDGTKGAFIGKNQWGRGFGELGTNRFWIKYGADSWGTEAIWMSASASPLPIPPVPPVVPPVVPPFFPPDPLPIPTPVVPTVPCGPLRHFLGRCDAPPRAMIFPNRPRLFR